MILPAPQHPQMGICQQLMTVTLLHWGQGGPGHGVRAVTHSPARAKPFCHPNPFGQRSSHLSSSQKYLKVPKIYIFKMKHGLAAMQA